MKTMLKRNMVLLLGAALLLSSGISWYVETEVLGNVRHTVRRCGESDVYTQAEINAAMDVAVSFFRANFGGCKLLEIAYIEEESLPESTGWAKQYAAKQAIVLHSSFEVLAENAWKEGLQPGKVYKNWKWILVRSTSGAWQLKTWGYG